MLTTCETGWWTYSRVTQDMNVSPHLAQQTGYGLIGQFAWRNVYLMDFNLVYMGYKRKNTHALMFRFAKNSLGN